MNKNYNHIVTGGGKKKMSVCRAVSQFHLLGANHHRINTGDSLLLLQTWLNPAILLPTGQALGKGIHMGVELTAVASIGN